MKSRFWIPLSRSHHCHLPRRITAIGKIPFSVICVLVSHNWVALSRSVRLGNVVLVFRHVSPMHTPLKVEGQTPLAWVAHLPQRLALMRLQRPATAQYAF